MRQHKDEFCCFLEEEVDFDDFCSKVESSNGGFVALLMRVEWGGQIELRAISMAFNRPIYVYSADSPVVIMGEDILVWIDMKYGECRVLRYAYHSTRSIFH